MGTEGVIRFVPTPKPRIPARQAVADIRSGMSDADLMAKYGLSATGLQALFRKLLTAGALKKDELNSRQLSPHAPGGGQTCPACGKPQREGSDECPFCGIVLAKFNRKQRATIPAEKASEVVERDAVPAYSSRRREFLPYVPVVLGVLGCLFLLAGSLLPVLQVPHQGRLNFFQLGESAPGAPALACFVIAIGLASGITVALKQYRWLWVSGGGCLVVLGYTFIRLRQGIARLSSEFGPLLEARSASPASQHGTVTALQDAVQQMLAFQMDVGWAVLVVGALFLIAAAFIESVKGSDGV